MEMGSKLKVSRGTLRKISVLLCQVPSATVVLFNVYKTMTPRFALQQKWA